MSRLAELYREGAARCRVAGLPIDDQPGGAIHQWVATNCDHRPETAFFIVLGICCAMADMKAQSEGWDSQGQRAAALAFAGCERDQFGKWHRK